MLLCSFTSADADNHEKGFWFSCSSDVYGSGGGRQHVGHLFGFKYRKEMMSAIMRENTRNEFDYGDEGQNSRFTVCSLFSASCLFHFFMDFIFESRTVVTVEFSHLGFLCRLIQSSLFLLLSVEKRK